MVDWVICRSADPERPCPVAIPVVKQSGLCYGCERTLELEVMGSLTERQRAAYQSARSTAMASAGEVLSELPDFEMATCPCGGDINALYHRDSLLHRTWLRKNA